MDNIKKLRMKLCLSQNEFAERIGTAKSSVSLYESGKRQPGFKTVRNIIELAKKNNIKIGLEDIRSEFISMSIESDIKVINIKEIRNKLDLTQIEFSHLIGCKQASVSKFEKNEARPSIETAKKIVELARINQINITLDNIFNDDI